MSQLSTTPDGTKVVPVSRVERAKRQKRRRRISLVVLIGLALTVGVAGKALAWHVAIGGYADCDKTTVSITVPDEPWAKNATASGTASVAGQSKSWASNGPGTVSVSFPGVNGGTATVSGKFNTGEPASGSKSIASVTDCEEEQTPPPPTTIKQPEKPKPVFHGTATDKKRTPPAVHRREPNPDDSITVTPPPTGQLPFTGPGDAQPALALGGLVLLLGGTLLVRASRRKGVEQE